MIDKQKYDTLLQKYLRNTITDEACRQLLGMVLRSLNDIQCGINLIKRGYSIMVLKVKEND